MRHVYAPPVYGGGYTRPTAPIMAIAAATRTRVTAAGRRVTRLVNASFGSLSLLQRELGYEAQHDRHRHRRQRRLDGEDLRHQRRVASHLSRRRIGIGRCRHRRAARDHREVRAGEAERCTDRNRDCGHHHQLERAGEKHRGVRVDQFAYTQACADDQQAECQRRASERVNERMRRPWDPRRERIEGQPDAAGPDEGVLHDHQRNTAPIRARGRCVAREHPHGERIEHGNHRDHRDGSEREAEVAIEIAGDGERHEGLPARRALKQRRERRRAGTEMAREQRPQREAERAHQEDGGEQRPANREHRHRGEIGARQRFNQQRREHHVIEDALQPDPVRIVLNEPAA